MIAPCRQGNLAAQVGRLHLQPRQLVVFGAGVVDVVGEDQIRLPRLNPSGQDAHPQGSGRDRPHRCVILGRQQRPRLIGFHRPHEGVGDQDAVVQVERLAIRIAAGGAADFDELLDLRMPDRQIDGGGPAPQRPLGDRERQRIHHPDERDHAGRLADRANFLPDRAQIAPVRPDAAALGCQPHILIPQPDDAIETVRCLVQKAGNRQAALGAAVGQDRGGWHEPHLAHVIVQALPVRGVVAVVGCDPGKQVLEVFAGHEVAVGQGGPAEVGQQRVPRPVDSDLMATWHLDCVEHGLPPWHLFRKNPDCSQDWAGVHHICPEPHRQPTK